MERIKKNPAYLQLKETLLDRIVAQEWHPGDRLPSERELCREYSLSRMTVRQAVSELERDGIVTRIQGKGTFVAKEKLTQPLLKLTSFSEDMRMRGFRPDAQILALEKMPANKTIAEKLEIEPGSEVIVLKRLRLADDEPLAIETAYLNGERFAAIYDQLAENESLYQLMKNTLHITLRGAKQSIELSTVQGWEAKLLHMHESSVVMKIERQTFDTNKTPVEYVVSKYRGDKYKFYIELFEL